MDADATQSGPTVCERCGAVVTRDSPRGLCRRCLARALLAPAESAPSADSGLRVRCPQCGRLIVLGQATGWSEIRCDSCGTRFSIVEDQALGEATARLDRIGAFEVLAKLGSGAFGTVWKARDTRLDRWVAIKIPRRGQLEAAELDKFLREARAAAQLRHPNIVSVFEVGREDDTVFIVADYVDGVSLAEWLAGRRISAREAAGLCRKLAAALEHAHAQGVIHRDIKPGNILVDRQGEPHLTDFGLARRDAGEATLTLDGQLLGTPAYMSPELARGEAHQADGRTDLYSLGVVLFQLLTGELPFRGSTRMLVHQVIHDDPPSPRKLNGHLPRDLETLCLKCLEKDAGHRYDSAQALGAELERFLNGEPILARPVGPVGRSWRWCRRKPALAAVSGVLLLSLGLGSWGVLSQWQRAERSAVAERAQRQHVEETLGRLELQRAEELFANGHAAEGVATLAGLLRQDPGQRAVAQRLVAELTHRNWALPALAPLIHADEVHQAEFSPDASRVLTASLDNAVRLWDATTGQALGKAMRHDREVAEKHRFTQFAGNFKPVAAHFSPDGRRVGTGSVDGTARVWDGYTGEPLTPPLPHGNWVGVVRFSPDGTLLATASKDRTVRLWDAATGALVRAPIAHDGWVNVAEFSPDGTRLLTGADDGVAQVWDVARQHPVGQPIHHGGVIKAGQFSPDGRRVATGSADNTGRIWDAASGAPLSPPLHHDNQVVALAFSPDGCWLATASLDTTVRLWDGRSGAPLGRPLDHGGNVRSVQFSPEGERLLSASEDGTVRLWNPRLCESAAEPLVHQGAVWSARFSPDGGQVVAAASDRTAQVWDVRPGAAWPRHLEPSGRALWAHWSPDGRWVAAGNYSPRLFDAATGRGRDASLRSFTRAQEAEFSPDGTRVVVAALEENARVWDWERAECVLQVRRVPLLQSVAYSPEGQAILTASGIGSVALCDARTGQLLRSLPHPYSLVVPCARFSPDGRLILTAAAPTVRIWERDSGQLRLQWSAHAEHITAAHFSPDGARVVTASEDGTARIWEAASGRCLTPPLRHRGAVNQVRFSPDSQRVVTASADHSARLWDAHTGAALSEPLRHNGGVCAARFSPDGEHLVTSARDGSVRLWDGRTGQTLSSPFSHPGFANDSEFSPDGTQWVTACQVGGCWIRDVPRVDQTAGNWLPEVAEALAGQRRLPDRSVEKVPVTEWVRLRHALASPTPGASSGRWLHWFLADRSERTVGPSSALTPADCLAAEVDLARLGKATPAPNLPALRALYPSNGLLYARATWIELDAYAARRDALLLARADWLSRRAVTLAPSDAAAWWARADVEDAAGELEAGLRTLEAAAGLPGASPQFWVAYGGRLERGGRDPEALEAYTRAIESNPPAPSLQPTERRRALLARSRLHARQGRLAEALADYREAYDVRVPPRDARASGRLLDLSDLYNANLDTDWRGTRFFRHNLSTLPRGCQTLGGIDFDIRGAIQLSDGVMGPWGLEYPLSVAGIRVNQSVRRIHFLHALVDSTSDDNAARYSLHLDDGRLVEFPLATCRELASWEQNWSWETAGPVVAWQGISPAGIPVRLYRSTWTNPSPGTVVQSIDFDTPKPGRSPLLVAITVD